MKKYNEVFRKIRARTVVWKAARIVGSGENCLVKLLLPVDTIVYECDGEDFHDRKCRADQAQVLEILGYRYDRYNRKVPEAYSRHDPNFRYTTGKFLRPKKKFSMVFSSCNSGIHFFYSRRDAVRWIKR